jgi:flotillin
MIINAIIHITNMFSRIGARSIVSSAAKYAKPTYLTAVPSKHTQVRHFSDDFLTPLQTVGGLTGLATVGTVGWLATRYKVATPGQYLVRTGIMIDDIDISKQAFWLPYQTLSYISLEPTTYHCLIADAMSQEKISFDMPTVFTVGPKDDPAFLKVYAKLLQESNPSDIKSKVIGILQGETRMAAGKTKLDDLFNNREQFKANIIDRIDAELASFGLIVYNANIEELKDMKGSEYFVFLRKRALEGAVNAAKVAVAEQTSIGEIGATKYVTETRQRLAEFEKEAKLVENERDQEVANSNTKLDIAKTDFNRQTEVAKFEAQASAEKRRLELQKEVEIFRNSQEIERLRAVQLSQAGVTAEVNIRKAQGVADALKLEADGRAYAVEIDAKAKAAAVKLQAEADAESMKLRAAADYVQKQNEAKGILELRNAEAQGLTNLIGSAGGVDGLNQYIMVRDGVLPKLAAEQAKALHGMNPNVTVWQTGKSEDGVKGLSGTITDLLKTGMPLLDGIKAQTGYDFLKSFKVDQPNNNKQLTVQNKQ